MIVPLSIAQNRLLDAIEQVSSNIPFCQNKSSFVISRELFAVSVEQVDPMEFTGNMLLVSLSGELFLEDNGNTSWNELLLMRDNTHSASVSLPIGLFNTLDVYNVTRVTHSVFLTDSLFAMRKESYQEVGSVIVSATVVNRSVEGLDPPITLTFLRNLVSVFTNVFLTHLTCCMLYAEWNQPNLLILGSFIGWYGFKCKHTSLKIYQCCFFFFGYRWIWWLV